MRNQTHTAGSPCEAAARRRPPPSQGERPQEKPPRAHLGLRPPACGALRMWSEQPSLLFCVREPSDKLVPVLPASCQGTSLALSPTPLTSWLHPRWDRPGSVLLGFSLSFFLERWQRNPPTTLWGLPLLGNLSDPTKFSDLIPGGGGAALPAQAPPPLLTC